MVNMKKLLSCCALALVVLAASAQWSTPNQAQDLPAYNALPPTHPMPAIMAGDQLTGMYFQQQYKVTAYKMAAKIPAVLAQQPCYCRCDREMNHNSLHSCFEKPPAGIEPHGAVCSTCMKEAVYSYQQTKKGKTAAQIRAGIEHGEWMNVDLEKATL